VKEFEALYAKACEGKSSFKIQKGAWTWNIIN
jgi:hypothetical protein